MTGSIDSLSSGAMLMFDLQDQFAANQAVRGPHPAPMGAIHFFLVNQTGNAQPFDPPREMVVVRNPSGFYLFFGLVNVPGVGVRRVDATGWPWTIRVQSDFYQQVDQVPPAVPLPASFTPGSPGAIAGDLIQVVLLPGPAYPFPQYPPGKGIIRLRGTMRNPDGTGIGGMPVQALDAAGNNVGPAAVTAPDGQWVLVLPAVPAGGAVRVRFTKPDGTFDTVPNVKVQADTDNNLAQTALRGQVRFRKTGISGAVVTVDGFPEQTITDSAGNWFYYFGPDQADAAVKVNAVLPNGNAASQNNVQVKQRGTVVVPSFDFQ